MSKELIAIGHPEAEYAGRLTDYLNEHNLLPLKALAFSEKGKLTRFEKQNPLRLKIITPEWAVGKKKEELGNCLFFTEEEEEGKMYVFRYRPADLMAKRICDSAGLTDMLTPRFREQKTKLIGIYSPVGRCLKTSFSLTLGQMLAARYRVLYLNFENYSGFGKVMGYNKKSNMADLLYYFLNLSEEFSEKMEEMVMDVGGMDVIPPALSFLDIENVTESEWDVFLTTLSDKGRYDYIILDLSDYMKGLYHVLEKCSFIYTITPTDGLAMAKVEQYEHILEELRYKDILCRTRKVTPPVFRKLPIRPEELVHSELAEYTRRITEDEFHWSKNQ